MQAIIRSHDHVAALRTKALAQRAASTPANAPTEPTANFEQSISSDRREWLYHVAKMRMVTPGEALDLIIAHQLQR